MKYLFYIFFFIAEFNLFAQSNTLFKLWYDRPAENWFDALPIGNGRLGAMVFGNPSEEKIQLNENTIWAGQPHRNDNPDAKDALPIVRKLIFNGKYKEAQDIINKKFISKNSHGMPYQTAGYLLLSFQGHENFSNYYRELNLENAVTTILYEVNGVKFKHEAFSSYPDQLIVYRITASKSASINFSASLKHPSDVNVFAEGGDKLIMSGITGDCDSIKGAVKFQVHVQINIDGGKIIPTDTSLIVKNADTATLYISIASSFNSYDDISANPYERANSYLQNVLKKSYEQILEDHVNDYQRYFNRVRIDLGISDAIKYPTNIRIENFANSYDPQLISLCFQFGRYLLISSSRPGGQPANLQGIWNEQLYPPWDSKYTININTEMNYWLSESTNLSELNEPLIQMIRELSITGSQTAKVMYGANGWVAHHNTDIWRIAGPVDGAFWGMWPMGSAWLCQHLWDKYEFNGDVSYLQSIYPIMKSAVDFYLDFLVEEPEHKWLVICPSISPENAPSIRKDVSVSAGTTIDNQLLFDLFTKTIRAAKILNIDKDFIKKIKKSLKRLPPMQIGKWGQLQEWIEDWDSPDDKHRHVSHLYGLFPSNQISPYRTPELFSAARTSLIARGDESTGWSMAWKINLWARLQDGNHAYKLIKDQLSSAILPDGKHKGGTYPNLFDSHPPFQIDGNFGFTSGIAEMLLQSHDGAIHFLPALPDKWKDGSVSGLKTRGNFEVSFNWKEGLIEKIIIKSNLGGNCRIRVPNEVDLVDGRLIKASGKNPNPFFYVPVINKPIISKPNKLKKFDLRKTFLYDFNTEAGKTYILLRKK